jgi:hypothetical protein
VNKEARADRTVDVEVDHQNGEKEGEEQPAQQRIDEDPQESHRF